MRDLWRFGHFALEPRTRAQGAAGGRMIAIAVVIRLAIAFFAVFDLRL
jgi:hypothetical protein